MVRLMVRLMVSTNKTRRLQPSSSGRHGAPLEPHQSNQFKGFPLIVVMTLTKYFSLPEVRSEPPSELKTRHRKHGNHIKHRGAHSQRKHEIYLSLRPTRTARKISSTMNNARFWKKSDLPAVRVILAAAIPRDMRFVFRNADRAMFCRVMSCQVASCGSIETGRRSGQRTRNGL